MHVNTRESTVQIVEDQRSALDVVRELATNTESDEPFFVVDLSDVVHKHKIWKMNLPRVEPFYAVKCNDTTTVLEVLAALGTGFDCASKGEIQKVMDLGVDQSRIIYANPCKTASFIRYAAGRGVRLMTFDNEPELHKIKAIYPDAELVVRIRVDGKAQCPLGIKFGVEPPKAAELLKVSRDLGLNVVGVSFHVGSGCEEATTYFRAIKAARSLFDFAERLGYKFSLLDLGGGFAGQKGAPVSFNDVCSVVNQALDNFFPPSSGVRIIAEPGRYYVASAFTLCANVIAKRVVQPDEASSSGGTIVQDAVHMYYINDGVYGSFNCLMFDHAKLSVKPLKEAKWQKVGRCSVWGPTCDSIDCIFEDCQLPVLDVGDWLVFDDMGAYTVAAASPFNGFQRPNLFFIASKGTWIYLQNLLGIVGGMNCDGTFEISAVKTRKEVCADDMLIENCVLAPEISVVDV